MAQNAKNLRNWTIGPVSANQKKIKKKQNTSPYQGNDRSLNLTKEGKIKNVHAVDNDTDNSDYDESESHTINNSDSRTVVTTKLKIQEQGREKNNKTTGKSRHWSRRKHTIATNVQANVPKFTGKISKVPSRHGLQRSKTPPPSDCPDMTLNNLMVKFQ